MIAGAVLAGGKSTRLGTDKTKLSLENAGEDLLHSTFACLNSIVNECWIVCRKEQTFVDVPIIHDAFSDCGPAAGIYTALQHASVRGYRAVFVLSADLPFIDRDCIKKLVKAWLGSEDALLTAYFNRTIAKTEMLAAIYSVRAIPLFRRAIMHNLLKLNAIIPWQERHLLYTTEREEQALFNINTPADLLQAQKYWATKKPDNTESPGF